jgi:16S rRNA processing protein RimM
LTDEKLATGIIKKSYGVKGYFRVHSFSGETEHFKKLTEVYLLKAGLLLKYKVQDVLISKKNLLMKLEGIDSPEKVKELLGLEIWVYRKNASPINKGEYYIKDICTCDVFQNNIKIGTIKSVLEGGFSDYLEVVTLENKVTIIPFRKEYVGWVNINKRKIYLKEDFEIT